MVSSITASYQTESVSLTRRQVEQNQPQEQRPTGDKVTLSKEGMRAGLFSGMGIDYTPGQSIQLEDLRAGLERNAAGLKDNVNMLFLENGISLTPPVELASDRGGHIRVKGDHPEKEKIEQLFADNPELANDFRKVSAMSTLINAADEHIEFAREYAKNPYAAVAKYNHLFNQFKSDEFSMAFGATSDEA